MTNAWILPAWVSWSICCRIIVLGMLCLMLPLNVSAAPHQKFAVSKPSSPEVHPKRSVVSVIKSAFDLAPETDSTLVVAKAFAVAAKPGESAIVLLDEGRTVITPSFVCVSRYHQIIRLMDQSAVQRYSEYPLSRPTPTAQAVIENARIFRADGTGQNVTANALHYSVNAQRNFLSIPSLAPGDLLDVSYLVADYHPNMLAHQFWMAWFFDSANTPCRSSRYVLITPKGLDYTTQNHGAIPASLKHDSGEWHIQEWRMTDIPALQTEVLGTNALESGTWLDISTAKSWSQIARLYGNLSALRCLPDSTVRAEAVALTKTAKTEDEKIHVLQAFVAHNIKYQNLIFYLNGYIPTAGAKVIRRGYGDSEDKAALLTALLSAVGIKSEMVLMSDRDQGLATYLPSLRFGHVLTCIQTAQGPLYTDACADYLSFRELPTIDQQVPALVVAPATTGLTETPIQPSEENSAEEIYTGTLSADGTLHGTFDWSLAGRQAWSMRLTLLQVPNAKQEEAVQSLVGYLITGAVSETDKLEI